MWADEALRSGPVDRGGARNERGRGGRGARGGARRCGRGGRAPDRRRAAPGAVLRPAPAGHRLERRQRLVRPVARRRRSGCPPTATTSTSRPRLQAPQPELAGSTARLAQLGNDHIKGAALQRRLHAALEPGPALPVGEPVQPRAPATSPAATATSTSAARCSAPCTSTARRERASSASSASGTTSARCGRRPSPSVSDVYAPFGDDPLLLHDVTITNRTTHAEPVSWFEYWDVNPFDQTIKSHARARDPGLRRGHPDADGGADPERWRRTAAVDLRRRAERPGRRLRDRRCRRSSGTGPGARRPRSPPTGSPTGSLPPPRPAGGLDAVRVPRAGDARPRAVGDAALRLRDGGRRRRSRRSWRATGAAAAPFSPRASGRGRRGCRKASFGPGDRGCRASSSGTPTCSARRHGLRAGVRAPTRSPRAATTSTAAGLNGAFRDPLQHMLPMI